MTGVHGQWIPPPDPVTDYEYYRITGCTCPQPFLCECRTQEPEPQE